MAERREKLILLGFKETFRELTGLSLGQLGRGEEHTREKVACGQAETLPNAFSWKW